MDEKKYAILAILESWLNSSVKNAEVEIDGYSLSRLDRPRNMKNEFGGGVCAYMRKTLKSKVLKDLYILCILKTNNSMICTCYLA